MNHGNGKAEEESPGRQAGSHAIVRRTAFLTAIMGCILLLFLISMKPLFYHLCRTDLIERLSANISGESVRIGFLLTNHRKAIQLTENVDFMNTLEQYLTDGPSDEAQNRMEQYLSTYIEGKKSWDKGTISSTSYYMVVSSTGDVISTADCRELAQSLAVSDWYRTIAGDSETETGSKEIELDNGSGKKPYYCFYKQFSVEDKTCFIFHVEEFEDYLLQLSRLSGYGITEYAFAARNEILYSNMPEDSLTGSDLSEEQLGQEQYGVETRETKDGYLFVSLCSLQNESLYLIVKMTQAEILQPFYPFFRFMQYVTMIILLLQSTIFLVIIWSILHRIMALQAKMAFVSAGNYDVDIYDDHNDEIGDIVRATRHMLSKIQMDMDERLKLEKQEQKMAYLLMISAIDPHFIYNTLDTVSFLASMGQNEDVITVNDALIATLKDRLRIKSYRTFDTVSAEKDVIEHYMIIQHYLASGNIICRFSVSDEDKDLMIPKNILQPLAENAIKHGLLTKKDAERLTVDDGIIEIVVKHVGDKIDISVSDNGSGMPAEKAAYYNHTMQFTTEHIGLMNIKGRLDYLFHDHFLFEISSSEENGTTVHIVIPDVMPVLE